MKVLMVDALEGNDYSLILCDHLQKLGVEVILATTTTRKMHNPVNFTVKHWAPSKDPQSNRFVKILTYFLYVGRILLYALTGRVDLVHFQFFRLERPESLLMAFLRLMGIPLVHTVHNILPHEARISDTAVKAIIYRTSQQLITHSSTVKKKLIHTFSLAPDKIDIIPHGNFDVFRSNLILSKAAARNRLALAEEGPILLFFGFIRPYKGLDILLDACEIAFKKNPSVRLLIAGQCMSEALLQHYKDKIMAMKSKDRIIFYPHFVPNDKVSEFFIATDWVVLPYEHIDYSGVIHMAYAFGRPVIATDVGSIKDMIKEDETGYVTTAGNSERLAETIIKAISNPKDRDRMGARGLHLGDTKYNWMRSAGLTAKVYERTISDGRRQNTMKMNR